MGLGCVMPIIVNGGITPVSIASLPDRRGGGILEQLVGSVEFEILDYIGDSLRLIAAADQQGIGGLNDRQIPDTHQSREFTGNID